MSITIKLDLPASLVAQARAEGLLESEAISAWIQEEIGRRSAGRELAQTMERIHASSGPELGLEEINAEIKALRAEHRVNESRPR